MKKERRVSFTIYRHYYDQIVAGTKNIEFRKYSDHWIKLLIKNKPKIAVFICGRDLVHRRKILKRKVIRSKHAAEILGRKISAQGYKDLALDKYPCVIAVWLGEVVEV